MEDIVGFLDLKYFLLSIPLYITAVEMRNSLVWRNHNSKLSIFKVLNVDIVFILDQAKVVRVLL